MEYAYMEGPNPDKAFQEPIVLSVTILMFRIKVSIGLVQVKCQARVIMVPWRDIQTPY